MNILVLGSGGREHAISRNLAQSLKCNQLFVAPGNAGTAALGTNVAVSPEDFLAVAELIRQKSIKLVVVGPEVPLVRGLVDFLENEFGKEELFVVGPKQQGAQLEGSKEFAKQFMEKYDVPTAKYRSFTTENLAEGLAYLDHHPTPIVLKADGLAAGKGVLITESVEEAKAALSEMIEAQKFGEASQKVVIEEFLNGIEMSVFVLTDGKGYITLPEAKDYKRIGEGDTGLNTGGMGSISPVPFATPEFMKKIDAEVIQPSVRGLQEENMDFVGFLFIGLMIVGDVPYVLEYNVRMGDPETQSVFPRIASDVVDLFVAAAKGKIDQYKLQVRPEAAATVIAVSGGYPEAYQKGKTITGLDQISSETLISHAGTAQKENGIVTSGGRVLAFTTLDASAKKALSKSRQAAESVQFEGKYFRRDIGFDLKLN